MNHRSPPDYGLFLTLLEEAHRHDLDAPFFGGGYLAVGVPRLVGYTQDFVYVGAVDVNVEEADLAPVFGQGHGEVDGHCGLADAALAAVDAQGGAYFGQSVGYLALLLPATLDLLEAGGLLGGWHGS